MGGNRSGSSDVEALSEVDLLDAQQGECVFVFDSLCDGLGAETVGECDHGFDQMTIGGVGG
jgi:hypothetical protein